MNIFLRVTAIVSVSTQLLGMHKEVILPKYALKELKEYVARTWESSDKVIENLKRAEKYWIGVSAMGNDSAIREAVNPYCNLNTYQVTIKQKKITECIEVLKYRDKQKGYELIKPEYAVFDHFWDNCGSHENQNSFSSAGGLAQFFVTYLAAKNSTLGLKKSYFCLFGTKPLRLIEILAEFDPSFDEELSHVFINDDATIAYVIFKNRESMAYVPLSLKYESFRKFMDSVSDVEFKFLKN